ncbi:MAG: glycosyltransferase family 9 protein [Plesiomonas sp.]|uniref:glycosyltransferase family 9 protein n=1 Tax=Plesiomonas sp. TaxID=2486279 RepID=UPI003EE582E7
MKFLVVQTKEIGDVLVSTALCNTLKKNYPQAQVDYLVMDYCAPVAECNPFIDHLIKIERARRKEWRYMRELLIKIRRTGYDVVINSQGQNIGLLTCLFSSANIRIGFDSLPWRLLHNRVVRFRTDTEDQGNSNMVDDRFALLKPLQLPVEDRSYHLWLTDAEQQEAHTRLLAAGFSFERPRVVLGVNSKGAYKCWPVDYFAAVAKWLITTYRAQILIYCGPGEEDHNRQVRQLLPEPLRADVFDQIPTSSIRDLAALMSQMHLFVGNDTGPRHISQALNIPSLAITAPSGDKRIGCPLNHPRFRAIDVKDALQWQGNDLSTLAWQKRLAEQSQRGDQEQALFRELTPEFVCSQLAIFIDEQRVFMPALDA